MKFIKYLAWTIVSLFVLVPSIFLALIMTSTGSQFLVERASEYAGIELTFEQLEGNLVSELTLKNLRVAQTNWQASAKYLSIAWQPTDLLDKRLVFKQIKSESFEFETLLTTPTAEGSEYIKLPQIQLPFALVIENLSAVTNHVVVDSAKQKLPDLSGQFEWLDSTVAIKRLDVEYQQVTSSMAGKITTENDYPINLNVSWKVNSPLEKVAIDAVTGTTILQGDLSQLSSVTEFGIAASPETHRVNVQLNGVLQRELYWLADVAISNLPTQPLLPLLVTDDSPWYEWLADSRITLVATVDNQQAAIQALDIAQIGKNSGSFEFDGLLSNYLSFNTAPDEVRLRGFMSASTIVLPTEVLGIELAIDSIAGNIEGNLDSFQHNLTVAATYAENTSATMNITGQGSTTHINLAQASIDSNFLQADFASTIAWSPEFKIQAQINALRAQPSQLPEELAEQVKSFKNLEVLAQGGIAYGNDKISADSFSIEFGDNHLSLNGTMTDTKPLHVEVKLPDLSNLYANDYVVGDVNLVATISGSLSDRLNISIEELALNHPEFGNWANVDAAKISTPIAQPLASSVEGLCLIANSRRTPAELCLDTQAQQSIQTTEIKGRNLPLSLLNRFRESDVAERIWGLANLSSTINYDTSTWSLIDVTGELRSERTILFALDEEVSTRFKYWQVDWQGNLETINTSITAELEEDKGLIIGDLVIDSVNKEAKLDGEILMELRDLTVMQWVLPDLRYEQAHALAQINIEGSTTAPDISGSVELAAQEIGFAQSGLLLTDVKIAAFDAPDVDDGITLDGQAQSGQGWISIAGLLQPLKPELELTIKGEQFRAIQVPTATVDISPDLKITLLNERIDVTGELRVPLAHIDQPELSETGVTASNDVEIYNNGEPVRSNGSSLYPVYADVRVTLGDDIKVSGFGFEGELGGSLRLTEAPTRALTASGNISVKEGYYEIYGQRLEIDRGSLIYSGGPIDNPGLDLRVERASENITATEDVRVGAQVSGTLQEPDFRLYSTPAMPDSEVLSYLILGRGSGTATGGNENLQLQALILLGSKGTDLLGESLQDTFGFDEFGIDSTMNPNDTSFYIGKYLSPKLYVKYGVGLFEDTNTFLVRYLLSDKLIIETTASSEAQGGDIFYTIEK